MAFKKFEKKSDREEGFRRQLFDVSEMNIKCRDCGTPITQLPFNPDPARLDSIRCQDCMRRFREQGLHKRF